MSQDEPKLTGGGQLDPNQPPENWRTLTDVCCHNCSTADDPCKGRRFREAMRVKKWEKIHPENPFGMTRYYRMFVQVCMDCGTELYYVDEDIHKNSKERPSHSIQ